MVKCVGIEIGSTSIRVVELLATSRSLQITQTKEYPLALSQVSDQELQKIEIMREIAQQYDGQTKIILALHQDQVSLKHKFFPFKDRQKVLKSLPFEMEDEIPLNSDDVIFDSKTIAYRGAQAEVIVVAAPKEVVLSTLALASDSGLDADILTVESFALANLFEPWNESPPIMAELTTGTMSEEDPYHLTDDETSGQATESASAYLVLHMGYQRTTLLVMRENRLVATRMLLWGAQDIAEKLAAIFSIPTAEAVKAIPEKAFLLTHLEGATKDQKAMSDAISESAIEMVRDLKLTLMEIKSIYNLQYSRMELVGHNCSIKNFGAFLTQRLELPVNMTQAIERIPGLIISPNTENIQKFAMALGLALEGIKKHHNAPVNLRRNEFQKRNRGLEVFWDTWGYTIQLLVVLFVSFTLYSVLRDSFATTLSEQSEANLNQVAETVSQMARPSVSKVEKHIKNQREKIEDSSSLEKLRDTNSAMQIVKRISDTLPMNRRGASSNLVSYFEIKKIQVEFDQVIVEGLAFNNFDTRQIEKSLKSIAKVATSVPATIVSEPGSKRFAYSLKVGRTK